MRKSNPISRLLQIRSIINTILQINAAPSGNEAYSSLILHPRPCEVHEIMIYRVTRDISQLKAESPFHK
jgi:hypothetical protein